MTGMFINPYRFAGAGGPGGGELPQPTPSTNLTMYTPIANLCDGNLANYAQPAMGAGPQHWMQLDYGAVYHIGHIYFWNAEIAGDRWPAWAIETSEDGLTWTVVTTGDGTNPSWDGAVDLHARYIRVRPSDGWNPWYYVRELSAEA